MRYKRAHIRVPARGVVVLSDGEGGMVEANMVDISYGGIAIVTPSAPLEQQEYLIEVTSNGREKFNFCGIPVHRGKNITGIKITRIDARSRQIVFHIVADYQSTDSFIKYISENKILDDWIADEAGNVLEIDFENEPM
jgi:hypothetical protein